MVAVYRSPFYQVAPPETIYKEAGPGAGHFDRLYGRRFSLFRFYNDTALLAPVTGFPFIRRFDLIKIVASFAVDLETFGAIPSP